MLKRAMAWGTWTVLAHVVLAIPAVWLAGTLVVTLAMLAINPSWSIAVATSILKEHPFDVAFAVACATILVARPRRATSPTPS